LLTYLLVSENYQWEDASKAYLTECFERNVMWYVKDCASLGDLNNNKGIPFRLEETFRLTKVSRDLLAFQVKFLDIAKPGKKKLAEVCDLYDSNYGFPTDDMESAIVNGVSVMKKISNYKEWFTAIKYPPLSENELANWLTDSVKSAQSKEGYYRHQDSRNNNKRDSSHQNRRDYDNNKRNRNNY